MPVHTALLRLQTEGEGQIIDLSAGIERALRATEVGDGASGMSGMPGTPRVCRVGGARVE